MPMQADARVFANDEISYAKQLRDSSVMNDIPHYIHTNKQFVTFVSNDCFSNRNMSLVLMSLEPRDIRKFSRAAINTWLCMNLVKRELSLFGYLAKGLF